MKFFELTYPDYSTDAMASKANPIEVSFRYGIPSVICPVCGTWGGSGALFPKVEENRLADFKEIQFLELEEWTAQRKSWADKLGLRESDIRPATNLGLPDVIARREIRDREVWFEYNAPIYMGQSLAESLESSGLSGFELQRIDGQIKAGKRGKRPAVRKPYTLWRVLILGRAWSKGMDDEAIKVCKLCGRSKPHKGPWVVERWDGSDTFCLDRNPNRMFGTERWAAWMRENKVENYALVALPEAEPVELVV